MIKKNKGYRFRLKPNKEQMIYLEKAFGCSRKMYNLYVDMLYKQLDEKNFINGKIDYKAINLPTPAIIKKDYEYMKEIDSLAFANVQLNFRDAIKKYNNEFDGKTYIKKALKQVETLGKELTFKDLKGIPNFKSKRKNQDSFTTNNQNGTISIVYEKYVRIPKLKEPIKFVNHRQLPENSIIKSVTLSKNCRNQYYISFTVEYYTPEKQTPSKIQNKISEQRKDWLHKKAYNLAKAYDAIIVEDINLRAVGQCLKLGKSLADNGFGTFRNFLKYKLEDKGKQLIKIDKWFPSSKMCSNCGTMKEKLQLSDRTYKCEKCGCIIDRDYNAALNIKEAGSALLAW